MSLDIILETNLVLNVKLFVSAFLPMKYGFSKAPNNSVSWIGLNPTFKLSEVCEGLISVNGF